MRQSSRIVVIAMLLASSWAGLDPQPVAAECFPRVPDGTPVIADYAFTATVSDVSVSADPDALARGEGQGDIWRVALRVDHVHRGEILGREIVWTGHTLRHLSCNNDVLGERLGVGDRLFVAIEDQFQFLASPKPYGRVLLWKHTSDRWAFYETALADDQEPDAGPYPRAAREATATADILAAISVRTPDTATYTSRPNRQADAPRDLMTLLLAALALAVVVRLTIRPPRTTRPSGDTRAG